MPDMPKHKPRAGAITIQSSPPGIKGRAPVETPAMRRGVEAHKAAASKVAPNAKPIKIAAKVKPPVSDDEAKLPKGFKLPKNLAECADLLYATKNERLAKEKEARESQKVETFLTEHIIAQLPKSKAEGVTGKIAHVERKTKDIFQVEDWPAFYENLRKKKAYFLLNKALSTAAVAEIYAAGKTVPGVAKHARTVLSITKRAGT